MRRGKHLRLTLRAQPHKEGVEGMLRTVGMVSIKFYGPTSLTFKVFSQRNWSHVGEDRASVAVQKQGQASVSERVLLLVYEALSLHKATRL
jgi:hypothetical protein